MWLGPERSVDDADRHRPARLEDERPGSREAGRWRRCASPHRVRLDVRVRGAFGELPVLRSASTERGARVDACAAKRPSSEARTSVDDREALREKLGRLGETPFELGTLEVDLPEGVMVPALHGEPGAARA